MDCQSVKKQIFYETIGDTTGITYKEIGRVTSRKAI